MPVVHLDCIGLPCPQPVLRVKDALEQGGECIEVLVDNEASKSNVTRFARTLRHEATSTQQPDGCFAITVTVRPQGEGRDAYPCEAPPKVPQIVYVISSDSMGRGSKDLGWALLQTYIQTIKELKPLPEKILLYNSGVKLVTAASGALEALKQLQIIGVEILVCSTCLDFFQLKSAIKVGQLSNMYEIMHSMASADKLVSPY